MRLAKLVGLNVATVDLQSCAWKEIVLLIERFDREKAHKGWRRKAMVSALTLFGLDEMMAMYASYQDLADIIRHRFTDSERNPARTIRAHRIQHSGVATRMTTRVTMLPSGMAKI